MTRQYKSMQEELMRRINTLETTIMEQKDQLDLARQVSTALLRAQIRTAAGPQDFCRREEQGVIQGPGDDRAP